MPKYEHEKDINAGDWVRLSHPSGGIVVGQAKTETRLGMSAVVLVAVSHDVDVPININFWDCEIISRNIIEWAKED